MRGEPLCEALLVVPGKAAGGVRRELDVVRRIGVDKIAAANLHAFEIAVREFVWREHTAVRLEVLAVRRLFVAPEGHVEKAARVEAAQTVIAGTVEIIEQRRSLGALAAGLANQFVEA